jgi:plasmid stabilization system protein ParE
MTVVPILTDEAEADVDEAAVWYEGRLEKLGVDFVAEVRVAIESIATHPLLYAEVDRGLRRASIRRFPYGVFYRVAEDKIFIVGVLHDRRDPSVWQKRL